MAKGAPKPKQADEVSKYGRMPGSTHTQMDFPIDERIYDAGSLQSAGVKAAVAHINLHKDHDILGKRPKSWSKCTLPGDKPGVLRFPDPCKKATNSRFQSIAEYDYNYRSEYVPRFEGPVESKPDRRKFAIVDERDDNRIFRNNKCDWKNDNKELCQDPVKAKSYKRGEQPLRPGGHKWDKPTWNVSVSTETMEDKLDREAIYKKKEKQALKASAAKNQAITTTRMGLIHRHNSVAAAIREKKLEAKDVAEGRGAIPKPLPPTIAAIRRSERQTKRHEHTGTWEMNKTEGRMMWSDTGSFDHDSKGDNVKIQTSMAWSFAAPN